MATELKTQGELYDIAKTEAQTLQPDLTDFNEGSTNDVFAGMFSVGASEISKLIIEKFNKTFVNTSHGPEVTGGPDDLQDLLVDHFGDSFARPPATKSVGVVAFSRPNTSAGNVTIGIGSIVKTPKDSNGVERRFEVLATVILTGTTINASVRAMIAGVDGNVVSASVTKIETSLTDSSITVTNAAAFTGGAEALNDAEYREFARLKIETIRGGTLTAVTTAANLIPGVVKAVAIEAIKSVKEWDIGGAVAIGDVFYIPYVKLYVSDANGTASAPLLALVRAAIDLVRSAGVVIEVIGATPLSFDWHASVVFNPSGPNFAVLNVDPTMLQNSMIEYLQNLDIGDDFVRATANAAIMAIWGPSGSDDLVSFTTVQPVGDVSTVATEKLIPGSVVIV